MPLTVIRAAGGGVGVGGRFIQSEYVAFEAMAGQLSEQII